MNRFSRLAFLSLFFSCSAIPYAPHPAGTESPADSLLTTGTSLDVDINGSVVLVDGEKNTVRLLSKDMKRVAEIGGSGWGDNQFDHPSGVWARNGIDIFIADYGNHRIQRFDRKLAFISSFSTHDRRNPDERFGYPTDVTVSRLGDLFICDSENSRIVKVIGLSKVAKAFGGFDAGKGRLKSPNQIEIGPHDNVYVQDAMPDTKQGSRVVVFDNFGNFIHIIGESMFPDGAQIYADENGLILLGGGKFYFFDENDRPVLTTEAANFNDVRSFVFSRGFAYVLTSQGLVVTPDPRKQ
ncbi:MAG: NHL repeat-containing protein [bacterium]